MKVLLEGRKWFHFIGIGGIGMSALAHILVDSGHQVTGSDLKKTEVTDRLESLGIKIAFSHSPKNITTEIDYVVISTAIKQDNEELVQCQLDNLPIIHRGDLLAQLLNVKKGIAVAGAHGKTTTTAMLAVVLNECRLDPTVIIGGDVPYFKANAQLGKGELIVAEADESDGSFLKLRPHISIITNIEDDHLDFYGTMEKVEEAFFDFTYRTAQNGIVVVCTDNKKVDELCKKIDNKITYGLESGELTAKNIQYLSFKLTADIYFQEKFIGKLTLNVPGKHNLLNALGVIGVGIYLGIDMNHILKALDKFTGVKRRFQFLGEVNNIKFVDDYAHHPTEIQATLAAAKKTTQGRIIAIFQPHRYSRTQALYKQFAQALNAAHVVILDEIYGAGEDPVPHVSSQMIIDNMDDTIATFYRQGKEEIIQELQELLQPGDLVLTLGAGDVWKISEEMLLGW